MAVLLVPLAAHAQVPVVAAENFYGDIAQQIGGPDAAVASILSSPDQDPHLFEASASTARRVSAARIVVFNGADYDPWIVKLLRAAKGPGRVEVEAAALAGRKPGDNPHLWYDPAIMRRVARAVSAALAAADPAHEAAFTQRLNAFDASLQPLEDRIAQMRQRHAGQEVTATEPVFGLMAAALGLVMRNERFQLAVMNDTEPRTSDTAAFEADLKGRRVRVLLYNLQATGPAAKRLLRLAQQQGIPTVGVTETEPAGTTYQAWMTSQLDALDRALSQP